MTELQRERDEGPPRYRAFISYSHADANWGKRLSRVLESYRVPATLVDTRNRSGQVLERRLGKMFRDRDELRASRSLSDSLHDALDRSDHLIVICSPSAVASPYVDAEIIHFKEQGRQDRIHALIVAGEPYASRNPTRAAEECLPRALRFEVDGASTVTDRPSEEPLAADARSGKDGGRRAILKLIAALLDVEFDLLYRRDHRRRRQQQIALGAVAAVVVAIVSVLGWQAWTGTREASERGRRNRHDVYVAAMNLTEQAYRDRDPTRILERLAAQAPAPRQEDIREFAWRLLWRLYHPEGKSLDIGQWQPSSGQFVFSPDGALIAVPAPDGVVRVVDMATGKERHRLAAHDGDDVSGLAFVLGGKTLLTTGRDGTVRLWDPYAGRELSVMRQEDPVGMVAVSSDGTRAATVSGSGRRSYMASIDAGSVTVWNLADGRRSVIENLGGRGGIVAFILPSGTNLLGVGYEYGSVVFHDVSTAEVRREVKFGRCCIARVALSPDNRMIAVALDGPGDAGSEVRIVDLDTGRERLTVTAPGTKGHHVQDVAFSPDGRTVALATRNPDQPPVTCGWDVGTGRQRFALSADQTGSATLLTFTPDGRMFATGGADGGVRLWETTTGVLRNLLGHHHARVWALGFSADGRTLASAGEDGTMRLWDAQTPADTVPTPQRFVDVEAMAFSRDGKRVATGREDGVLAVYATGSVTLLRSMQAHATAIESIAFSPDGELLATSARDGTITVRDASTFAERATFRGQAGDYAALSFDGASILHFGRDSESGPGRIREWALSSGGSARWSDKATIVAVSADGRRIATIGGYDGSGHCELKVRTRGDSASRVMTRCNVASPHFTAAALSPDGRYLAVGGPDLRVSGGSDAARSISGVLIYDLESRRPPARLALEVRPAYEYILADVVFSPDGRLLATASIADRVEGQDARGVAINVWSVPDGRRVKTFVQPYDAVCGGSTGALCARTVRFSPDARALHFLRGGNPETELVRLDLAGGERRARLVLGSRIDVMEFFAEGMFATLTAHGDAPVLWDAVRVQPVRAVGERRANMADVTFNDDGVVAATIDSDWIFDPTVRFWNITKGESLQLRATAPVAADRVTFSADGRSVALERQDHLSIRELDGWRQLAAVDGLTRTGQFTWSMGRPAFTLDGRLVAVSTSTSVVLQSTSGESPRRLPGQTVAALSPDGTSIAIDDCPELHLLDVTSGRPRAQLHSDTCVRRAAFSPDGTTIVTIAGQARLWRVDNGREVLELEGFRAEDAAVAFSPDGKTLATGGANGNVDLWNPQNGRRLLTLTAGAAITALAFSPDGATLAAVTPAHVRLWRAALTVPPQVEAAGTR